MSARRTVEQIKRKAFAGWQGNQRIILSPDEAGVWLATSRMDDCLTHLVRWMGQWGRCKPWYETQCGYGARVPVAVADETFVCARCIAIAEKYGEPTFGMIPTSSCEVSNGKRRGRPPTKRTP